MCLFTYVARYLNVDLDVGITEEKSQECTKGLGEKSRERADKMRKAEKYVIVFFELATVLL